MSAPHASAKAAVRVYEGAAGQRPRSGALHGATTIFLREWRGLVYAPIGWIALAAFAVAPGIAFALGALTPGSPVSMRLPLQVAAWCLFVTAPVLALRSIAEERRAGTWDLLIASPATAASIIVGKVMALALFLGLFSLPLLAHFGLLSLAARPDPGEFLCGLLGVMLAGLAILASAVAWSVVAPGGIAAYLLTIGFWSAWLLLARALPTIVPPEWVAAAYGVDPLRRVDDFLLGMLDPANVIFFLASASFFIGVAIDGVAESMRSPGVRGRRVARLVVVLGAGCMAVAAIGVASEPPLRRPLDLTRTRSWTLSERTHALIGSIEGEWRIEVIAGPDSVDALALRQIDEVLARFDGLPTKGGRVSARRLDPADPDQSIPFVESLERLERQHGEPLRRYGEAIDGGLAAYERLVAWAGAESNALTALLAQLPAGAAAPAPGAPTAGGVLREDDRAVLEQWRAICGRLATDHRSLLDAVRSHLRSSDRQPLADPVGAASIIESTLQAWIGQCNEAEAALRELRRRERLPEPVVLYLRDAPKRALDLAQALAGAEDRLRRLPELALAEVAAALRAGETVIVSGPGRVAAIPGWQLLPVSGAEASTFDRRFRGEEVIAGAIRSLERGDTPEVVFVHGEGRSLLRASADRLDFAALADALRSVRCSVREWQPAAEPRPMASEGRRQVWVVIPPFRRGAVEVDPRERRLLDAAGRLIDERQPILLAVAPSVLPLIGQPDPWAELAQRLGVDATTGRTVLELVATSERQREVRAYFELESSADHPAARSAASMRTLVSEPVPMTAIRADANPADGTAPRSAAPRVTPLLEIGAAGNRWLEDDWRSAARRTVEVPESKRFDEPVTVIAAIERTGGARAVVSGGAGWMLSGLSDITGQLGPDRVFLRYPGNRELFVGLVGWLAGLDGAFASGTGREVERLPALSPAVRGTMAATAIAGVPGSVVLVAFMIALRRRRA